MPVAGDEVDLPGGGDGYAAMAEDRGMTAAIGGLVAAASIGFALSSLPPDRGFITAAADRQSISTVVLDRNDRLLQAFHNCQWAVAAAGEQRAMSARHFLDMLIAYEDKRPYTHDGRRLSLAMARAAGKLV